MTLSRLLVPLVLFTLTLALAGAAVAQSSADLQVAGTGSGGALASPLRQGADGGGMAPDGLGKANAAGRGAATAPPSAAASQATTPTTPEGQQQPNDQPAPDQQQTVPDQQVVVPGEQGPASGQGSAGGGSALGLLPSTGLEIAALAAVGLGLLTAGVALRPRRRVAAEPR